MRLRQTRMWQDLATQSMFGRLDQLTHGIWQPVCMSLEREWQDNRPNISCVPVGTYTLVPHSGAKYRNTLALVGHKVSYLPQQGVPRSVCVLHKASVGSDLQGCVAWGWHVDQMAVGSRLSVLDAGIEFIENGIAAHDAGEVVLLTIRNAEGFEP